MLLSLLKMSKFFIIIFRSSAKRAILEHKEYKEIREIFAAEPYVTIHMSAKERKDLGEFNKKTFIPKPKNLPPQNFGYPQFHPGMNVPMTINPNQPMYPPMNMNPGMTPGMNMHRPYGQMPTNNNN